ncbi:hypothetical protein N7478_007214 [Penicillium angulare]|uniref:uncharacterized protein n=1 Tax=Penicillium angulare TaxID=116970 RepID=UPI002541EEF7|nr:uncharacterized protein N7478_007214 [Penicillium angulare]KAJ5281842.1 hypothetical protein N7478_007214 [Penicillium angulare]
MQLRRQREIDIIKQERSRRRESNHAKGRMSISMYHIVTYGQQYTTLPNAWGRGFSYMRVHNNQDWLDREGDINIGTSPLKARIEAVARRNHLQDLKITGRRVWNDKLRPFELEKGSLRVIFISFSNIDISDRELKATGDEIDDLVQRSENRDDRIHLHPSRAPRFYATVPEGRHWDRAKQCLSKCQPEITQYLTYHVAIGLFNVGIIQEDQHPYPCLLIEVTRDTFMNWYGFRQWVRNMFRGYGATIEVEFCCDLAFFHDPDSGKQVGVFRHRYSLPDHSL